MKKAVIKIGTRGSPLALIQAEKVKNFLSRRGLTTQRVIITSKGDLDRKSPLYKIGGKGVFTRSLEKALINGEIDLAVHSAKDLPSRLIEGTELIGVLPRGSVEDVAVVREEVDDIKDLIKEGVVATGSLRRRAFLRKNFGAKNIVNVRGNVDTRVKKLKSGEFDILILAKAGLERLNLLNEVVYYPLDIGKMIPSPAQAFIVVQARKGKFNDLFPRDENWLCFQVERMVSTLLQLDCRTPVGLNCTLNDGKMIFKGAVLTPDGSQSAEVFFEADKIEAKKFAEIVYKKFLEAGVEKVIERIRQWQEK